MKNTFKKVWLDRYCLAKAYYDHYGHLEMPTTFKTKNGIDYDENGIVLGVWVQQQYYTFQEGRCANLSDEIRKLLEEIGIVTEKAKEENKKVLIYKKNIQ